MSEKTCAILLKGDFDGKICGDFIICADAGTSLANKLNITPDIIIGDMDSRSDNSFENVENLKYSPEKDFTDGELCILYAKEHGFEKVNIYGAEGGSLDHIFCNVDLLKRAFELGMKAVCYLHNGTVELISGLFKRKNIKGKRISLVPYGYEAHIKYTDGLKYKISDSTVLRLGNMGLGLSNVAIEDEITIMVEKGAVLYFELKK